MGARLLCYATENPPPSPFPPGPIIRHLAQRLPLPCLPTRATRDDLRARSSVAALVGPLLNGPTRRRAHKYTPVDRLHRRTVLSLEPDTTVSPSAVTQTDVAASVWPSSVFSSSPGMRGQKLAVGRRALGADRPTEHQTLPEGRAGGYMARRSCCTL